LDNWAWGLSLIALTIAIHVAGVTFLVSVLHSFRVRLESRSLGLPYVIAIAAFTAMGLLLAVLHGIMRRFGRRRICGLARSIRLELRSSTPSI
jgi:hypothetical protein